VIEAVRIAPVKLLRVLLPWSAGLCLLVVGLYLPTLRGGFVYDSIAQVLYSDYIHTPTNWDEVLSLRVIGQDQLDRNRPLHLASLMLDAAIWKKEPFGYRLTSVLLHAINAALLFAFVAIALRGRARPVAAAAVLFPALFGALVFALHPLVVEAVAEPSNREDVLVLLPMLIGLLAIAAPIRSPHVLNTILVLCSFFAVLAKESGIAVPFVFAVAAWLFGRLRSCRGGLIAGVTAVGVFLATSYLLRPEASGIFARAPAPLGPDLWSLLATQLRIWALQLSQIVWPWQLSAHYPPQVLVGFTAPVALAMIVAAIVAVFLLVRVNRLAWLGVAIFVFGLLPASNFVPQYHPIADRYLYVPMAGVGFLGAIALLSLFAAVSKKSARIVMAVVCIMLLSLEYAANIRRQLIWQQPATLWPDVLRQFPRAAQAHIGMANVHGRAGDHQSALAAANEAILHASGQWAEPYALRAIALWQLGNTQDALVNFRKAQSLSRVYAGEDSMSSALFFSREQLDVLRQLLRQVQLGAR
jgi:protein O-mannosyl-transferase